MEIHSTAVPSEVNMKLWRVNHLTRHGYQILCRNFRCRQGEIDIIAKDRDYLVFIEVKYRRDEHEGDPAEAVDARKQARILRTARYYMTRLHISEDTPCPV